MMCTIHQRRPVLPHDWRRRQGAGGALQTVMPERMQRPDLAAIVHLPDGVGDKTRQGDGNGSDD